MIAQQPSEELHFGTVSSAIFLGRHTLILQKERKVKVLFQQWGLFSGWSTSCTIQAGGKQQAIKD